MKISIELYINGIWETHIRHYYSYKSLQSDDLIDIPNKRKNAKILDYSVFNTFNNKTVFESTIDKCINYIKSNNIYQSNYSKLLLIKQ